MTTAVKQKHEYRDLSAEAQEQVLNQFLIDSWSYSKVTSFARNEKAFEMMYIYNYRFKSSPSSVAGSAYHAALEKYFLSLQDKKEMDVADLEAIAYDYIDDVEANNWKRGKTTPTVEECKVKAYKDATALVRSFIKERSTYLNDIEEVLGVEIYTDEFLNINGVDIPLPCHAKIDLVVRLKSGRVAIIDHKGKTAFTTEEELALVNGIQAITYVKSLEAAWGDIKVDEVWFVENKISQNRDGSPQVQAFKIQINRDTCKLYEALLYEPLRRMIAAVHDPDYVYLINDSDNYVDKAELYEFWAKTMIAEVEDFDIQESKKELISKRLKKIRDASISTINPKVVREFRKNAAEFIRYDFSTKDMTNREKIEHVLRSFGVISNVAYEMEGYSSNTYLLEVSAGVKVSSIFNHRLDIANALDVSSVRINADLVVHEGKAYIGIESAKKREKFLFFDKNDLVGQRIPIGKDNFNQTVVWDLNNNSTPHVLVCGATGSGKSVMIKSTIEYARLAGISNVVILDPKYEFTEYNNQQGVEVYNDIADIEAVMSLQVEYMNELVKTGEKTKTLIVFDEFADAVAQSRKGNDLNVYDNVVVGHYANGLEKTKREVIRTDKPLEENLRILLQKGRSLGFRIIAATQRASVKVITGDSKVNFPVQVCFRVPKETDSRVVIDEAGAESLMGAGDGLIKSPEYNGVVRFQGYFFG